MLCVSEHSAGKIHGKPKAFSGAKEVQEVKTHYTPATRILCMLLCLVMLLGMMPPMSARAEEDQSSEPQSTSVETAAEETTAEEPVEQLPDPQEESSLDAPAVNAAATEPAHTSIVWSKSELGTGYKYVPKVMANNSGFINDYVFNSNKLNLNDRFTKISGKNAKGAGNSLPISSKIRAKRGINTVKSKITTPVVTASTTAG